MGANAEALNGRWDSDDGSVTITADGDAIKGDWPRGSFEGQVADDGTVTLSWTHRDGTPGKAKLKVEDKNKKLAGTWGFDSSDSDGGEWVLTLTKHIPVKKPEPPKDDKKADDKKDDKADDKKDAKADGKKDDKADDKKDAKKK